jgi:hypothetical protein
MPAMGLPNPTQAAVTESMDAMMRREFTVDGIPTSLADLGYTRASVDGRYIACVPDEAIKCGFDCGGVNGSYVCLCLLLRFESLGSRGHS